MLPEIKVPRHFCPWMGKFHMVLVLTGHVSDFMALGPVAYPACTFYTVCAQYKLIAMKKYLVLTQRYIEHEMSF